MKQENKLLQYSSLAVSFIFLNEGNAQVIYADIEPDVILDEALFATEVDMNNDGLSDFFFHNNSFVYYDTSWLSNRIMKNILVGPDEMGNALAGISNYFNTGYNGFTWYYPFALEKNVAINDVLTWQGVETQIMALRAFSEDGAVVGSGGYCYWFNFAIPESIDKYLGVRFNDLEGLAHYGWIRCDVLEEGKILVIKDYAYESEPDYPIITGDTTHFVAISEIDNSLNANVYSFNKSIFINLSEFTKGVEIHIYDLNGKMIYSDQVVNSSTQIELNEAKGVYFVELVSGEKKCRKKVYIN